MKPAIFAAIAVVVFAEEKKEVKTKEECKTALDTALAACEAAKVKKC